MHFSRRTNTKANREQSRGPPTGISGKTGINMFHSLSTVYILLKLPPPSPLVYTVHKGTDSDPVGFLQTQVQKDT